MSAVQVQKRAEPAGGTTGQLRLIDKRAVAHGYEPVRRSRDPRVMGNDDERLAGLMQTLEQPEDVERGLAIEVACWLVGEYYQRPVGQCPGDCDPLPSVK